MVNSMSTHSEDEDWDKDEEKHVDKLNGGVHQYVGSFHTISLLHGIKTANGVATVVGFTDTAKTHHENKREFLNVVYHPLKVPRSGFKGENEVGLVRAEDITEFTDAPLTDADELVGFVSRFPPFIDLGLKAVSDVVAHAHKVRWTHVHATHLCHAARTPAHMRPHSASASTDTLSRALATAFPAAARRDQGGDRETDRAVHLREPRRPDHHSGGAAVSEDSSGGQPPAPPGQPLRRAGGEAARAALHARPGTPHAALTPSGP